MKKWIAIIALVLALIVSTGIALAAFVLNLPSTVTITPASTDVSVWADSGCTAPMTSIAFGDCRQGSTSTTQNLYIRNEGDVAVTVTLSTTGLSGNITLEGTRQLSLEVGEVKCFDVWLAAAPATVCGPASFTVVVSSEVK